MLFDPVLSPISWVLKDWGLIDQNINFLGDAGTPRIASASRTSGAVCPSSPSRSWPDCRPCRRSFTKPRRSMAPSAWQRFISVTLPVIRTIVLITTLFSIIWTFSDFQLIYVLTKGGPANSTHVFGTYAYQIGMNVVGSRPGGRDLALHVPVPGALRRYPAALHPQGGLSMAMVGRTVVRQRLLKF